MTNFSGAVRARAGCGGAVPGRAGEAALGCPDNSVDERLVLKNTPATPGNRGWGWPPASQRFTLPSGVPPPRRSGSVRGGVDVCVCGALPASPPSLSPPRSALIAGRSGGHGPGGRGPLTVVPHLGVPVKVRPDAVADEEGADLEATLPCHGAAGAKRTCQGACPHHHPR